MTRSFLLAAVLALCACTQGGPDYISAEIDGKRIEFREHPYAIVSGTGGRMETLTFAASVAGSNGTAGFEVDLELPGGQLAATRYSGRQARLSAPRPGFRLNDSLTVQYTQSDGSGSYTNDTSDDAPGGDFVVEVTSLRDGRVEGVFSGGLDHSDDVVHVSNGRFSLAYVYKKRNTPW